MPLLEELNGVPARKPTASPMALNLALILHPQTDSQFNHLTVTLTQTPNPKSLTLTLTRRARSCTALPPRREAMCAVASSRSTGHCSRCRWRRALSARLRRSE